MATVEQLVPPLVAGDKLSREEFLFRWESHPEIKKAELIGGIVYMPSPVSIEHGDCEGDLGGWVAVYKAATPGTASGHNTTSFVIDDCPQPDVNLRILTECGGASWAEGKYLHGAPELLAEICRSSSSYDLHQKLELYQAAGIQEYLAVLLFEREVRWQVLADGAYRVMAADPDGILKSRVFPGLWLDGRALLAGNMAQVLAILRNGIASPEHQVFVDRLAAARK